MASAQEKGLATFYIRKKTGKWAGIMKKVFAARVEALSAGGCPDGVPAAKPSDWLSVPVIRAIKANPEDQLVITYTSDGADTIDASDNVWSIPIMTASGLTFLGNNSSDFDVKALADTDILVAGAEQVVAIHKFKEPAYFGGGKIYFSMEDDT